MASGKQLSFSYGEISPSLRYKSDSVSYSQGLAKLRNMIVRRDGGVSNRPGLELVEVSSYQYGVNNLQEEAKIRTFVSLEGTTEIAVSLVRGELGISIYVNGEPISVAFVRGAWRSAYDVSPLLFGDILSAKFIPTKDGIFITPQCTMWVTVPTETVPEERFFTGNIFIQRAEVTPGNFFWGAYLVSGVNDLNKSFTSVVGFSGIAPFLPVSYYITASMEDGREIEVGSAQSSVSDPTAWGDGAANPSGNSLCMPHSQLTSYVKIDFANANDIKDVKQFSLYRASGANGKNKSFFKLVSRIANPGGETSFAFNDYGADDPGRTPPIDKANVPVTSGNPYDYFLREVDTACYYQQRLLVTFSQGNAAGVKPNEIVASRIGAPRHFMMPLITSETDCFKFSTPSTDTSDVVAILSMERAIVLTLKGVYILRGDESGVLAPLTVNPFRISDEGASPAVEPTFVGNKGYWLNYAQTKLMTVIFGNDGNCAVFEASLLSNHLMKKTFVQMEAINAEENLLYILVDDGTLVQVTCSDDGTFGFATVDTEGYVESIYRAGTYLYAYVIRNGIRFKERIVRRNDTDRKLEMYADAGVYFGSRPYLTSRPVGQAGYFQNTSVTPFSQMYLVDASRLNIMTPGDNNWNEGQVLKVRGDRDWITALQDQPADHPQQDFKMHFFYKDEKGNESTLRFNPDVDAGAVEVDHAQLTRSSLKVTSKVVGYDGAFRLQYYAGATAGSEDVEVYSDLVSVQIQDGVSTAQQIMDALLADSDFTDSFEIELVGSGTIPQVIGTTFSEEFLGWEIQGTFSNNVPEQLRDVRAKYTRDQMEWYLYQTNWAPAFRYIYMTYEEIVPGLVIPLQGLYRAHGTKPLSVVGEGEVLSSPLNYLKINNRAFEEESDYFMLDLGDFYSWGYIGIPYVSEIESLDIEAGDNRTLSDAKKLINAVGVGLMETRGGFYGLPGQPYTNMVELETRTEDNAFLKTANKNGYTQVPIPSEWTEPGRVAIKNVDPVPMSILSVYPKGLAGD